MSYFESFPEYRAWPTSKRNIHLQHTPIIDHDTKIVNIGSCFGEMIQIFLDMYHFNIIEPQIGYKYSSHSILREVSRALHGTVSTEDSLYICDNGYTDFNHHRIFDTDKSKCLRKIQTIENNARESLQRAEVAILTPSLTEVWRNRNTGEFILHPYPGVMRECQEFEMHYLTTAENLTYLEETRAALMEFNPSIQIIANVCPTSLRATHLNIDAIQANNASKSTIYAAINDFCAKYENVSYFPGFDIVNYELSDEKYYREDNRHLNPKSIKYYMNCFGKIFFTERSSRIATLLEQLEYAPSHKQRSLLKELDDLGYDPDLLRIKLANHLLAREDTKTAFDTLCHIGNFNESPAICLNLGLLLLDLGVPAKAKYFFTMAADHLQDIFSLSFAMADRTQRLRLGDTHMKPYTNISATRERILHKMSELARALSLGYNTNGLPKLRRLMFCDTFTHDMFPTFQSSKYAMTNCR